MFIMKTNVIELSIPQANDSLYFLKKGIAFLNYFYKYKIFI